MFAGKNKIKRFTTVLRFLKRNPVFPFRGIQFDFSVSRLCISVFLTLSSHLIFVISLSYNNFILKFHEKSEKKLRILLTMKNNKVALALIPSLYVNCIEYLLRKKLILKKTYLFNFTPIVFCSFVMEYYFHIKIFHYIFSIDFFVHK